MPSCCSIFANFFRTVDLFPTSTFLRYNGEAEYKTITGGIISISVLIVFVALFYAMGIRTAKKEIIISSTDTFTETDPSSHTFTIGPGGDFMLAVLVNGIDLSATANRYFDVTIAS